MTDSTNFIPTFQCEEHFAPGDLTCESEYTLSTSTTVQNHGVFWDRLDQADFIIIALVFCAVAVSAFGFWHAELLPEEQKPLGRVAIVAAIVGGVLAMIAAFISIFGAV